MPKLKYLYPTVNQKIKQYWVIEVIDYDCLNNIQKAYKQLGLKTKYIELDIPGSFVCFYIGKKPTKFIKNLEFDINSGNPG